jgi:alkanesulfonate monooxygenase SsuD/methylene tetrahydromethanopterin reductase-like flavin-dependent oxidoreductase (luciferase family)
MGDGWFPQFQPDSEGAERIGEMRQIAVNAGRNPADIGIEGRIGIATDEQDNWGKLAESWAEVGATHLSVNTMRAGLIGPDQHIEAIRRFKETVSG